MDEKQPGDWIKIYRQLKENGWLKNHELCVFWIWCLLTAAWKEKTEFIGATQINLKPGQLIFRRGPVSEELRISNGKLRYILTFLTDTHAISQQTTNKFTIITLNNWASYQGAQPTNNQQTTNKQPTNNQQSDLYLIYNKKERKKEYNISPQAKFLIDEYFKKLPEKLQVDFEKYHEKFEIDCQWLLDNKYSEEEIRNAVNWAREDKFWSSNFKSFSKLRDRNKEHVRYIDVFIEKWQASSRFQKSTGPVNPTADYYKRGNEKKS